MFARSPALLNQTLATYQFEHNINSMPETDNDKTRKFRITSGFTDGERAAVAQLFWEAFRGKLGKVMGPDDRASKFFADVVSPKYALVARSLDDKILGIAGFKTADGAFAGGTLSDMTRHYGRFGGFWRGILLETLERNLAPDVLLMDGIFVDETARGRGVGSALLQAIGEHAASQGLSRVRLDVIDQNPRARSLYARIGFQEKDTQSAGVLRWLFGFSSSTTMELRVK
ncbi:MAG: GNAT family N-acetyltransferase [Boseongicola sp.]